MSRSLYLWEKESQLPNKQQNWWAPIASLEILEKKKISCTCQELNSVSMLWHRLKMWAVKKCCIY